ncbi:MAG: CCA tRNA nucleotidyltransferase, partial [Nitrosopumilaceae archaeon]
MWVDNAGKILSLQERTYYNAKTFLQNLLKKNLSTSGIPSGLVNDIRREFKILNGTQTTSKSIKKALLELITTDGLVFGSA